jgi:hypothetical protein
VPKARYYSPQLERDLITSLYHTARSRRVPMTRLASMLVRDGLARMGGNDGGESAIVREDPPAPDPSRRKD